MVSKLRSLLEEELGIGKFDLFTSMAGFLVGHSLFPYARRLNTAIYRFFGFHIGESTLIYGKLQIAGSKMARHWIDIGSGCRINAPCRLEVGERIQLEDDVVLGFNVTIITTTHQTAYAQKRAGGLLARPVRICRGAWIAANVTILPGVTIGEGAVVGAGSVVTRDVPAHTLAAGSPARVIRSLADER